jgi:hypothetical protein
MRSTRIALRSRSGSDLLPTRASGADSHAGESVVMDTFLLRRDHA